MHVSVLMSTYNGKKFIVDQLESLYSQTKRVDEVVIIDDCSTDDTISIIEEFVNNYELTDSWKLYKNVKNKGWRINFIEGIKYVSGDILFYSDQDDIWFENKVEMFCDVLDRDSSINVVVSKETLWEPKEPKPVCRLKNQDYSKLELSMQADEYLIHTSGCCMAIRMDYVRKVLPYCFQGWAHDDFFWKMGVLDGSLAYMNASTILHRITGVNESRRKNTLEKAIWSTEIDIQIANALLQRLDNENIKNKEKKRKIVQHKLKGSLVKQQMLQKKSLFCFFKIMVMYSDIYRRRRQIVGDYLRAVRLIH